MRKILGVGIFGIFIISILFVVFSSYLRTGNIESFTFKSLIDVFSNVPLIDVGWSEIDLTVYADWGPFNFLKSIWNPLASIWEFCVSIIGMLWQGLNFMFYFVRSLFV